MTSTRRAWLTRNLLVLTAVSFAQDAASELLYPLLPVLVTGVLAAPPVVLGVVEGLADATAGVSKYVAGRWSDRRGGFDLWCVIHNEHNARYRGES